MGNVSWNRIRVQQVLSGYQDRVRGHDYEAQTLHIVLNTGWHTKGGDQLLAFGPTEGLADVQEVLDECTYDDGEAAAWDAMGSP